MTTYFITEGSLDSSLNAIISYYMNLILLIIFSVRYLAKRGKINGSTPQEEVKCDMIAESCKITS
jgi:hypothetical protein